MMQTRLVTTPRYNPFRQCAAGSAPIPFPVARSDARKQPLIPNWRLAMAWLCLALMILIAIPKPAGLSVQVSHKLAALPGLAFLSPHPSRPPTPAIPVRYTYISSAFGMRNGRPHQGMDFAAPQGASIIAAAQGQVVFAGWQPGYGQTVILDHGQGLKTRYAHCSQILVQPGQKVLHGGAIAKVGSTGHSTGPHLHFEVIEQGIHKNPAPFLALK